MPGGEGQEGMMPVDQGFRVTPGEALTSSHAAGTKNMQAYGTLKIELPDEAMTILTLDGTELAVLLDEGQSSFSAAAEENTLILIPEAEGEAWSISAFALKILNRSGIETVRLMFSEGTVELTTDLQLQGAEFAKLSAAGYVSKDYLLTVTADDLVVSVAQRQYRIDENNELVGG